MSHPSRNDIDLYPVFPRWDCMPHLTRNDVPFTYVQHKNYQIQGKTVPVPDLSEVPRWESSERVFWCMALEMFFDQFYHYAWINNECQNGKDLEYERHLISRLAMLEQAIEYWSLPTVYDECFFDWPKEPWYKRIVTYIYDKVVSIFSALVYR
jgi:hypothetical protein